MQSAANCTNPSGATCSGEDSLSWLALRYVLGELTESQAAAWEMRLADDEAACAAVVEATQLVEGLQVALSRQPRSVVTTSSSVVVSSEGRTSRRSISATLALLSTSAAAVFLAIWVSSPNEALAPRQSDSGAAVRLVGLWRDSASLARSAAVSDPDVSDAELDSPIEQVTIPSWLLAAVSLEEARSPDGKDDEVWEDN